MRAQGAVGALIVPRGRSKFCSRREAVSSSAKNARQQDNVLQQTTSLERNGTLLGQRNIRVATGQLILFFLSVMLHAVALVFLNSEQRFLIDTSVLHSGN